MLSGGVAGGERLSPEQVTILLSGGKERASGLKSWSELSLEIQCTKNKGEGQRGYQYSRGCLFMVRGSGIVDLFAPVYRYA